jgi:hypothetical protein
MIGQLDLSAVEAVIVSYLELTEAPAQLRYLIRRLRHRAPQAALIAGVWAQGEAVLTDTKMQAALGADRYVGSLREAIDASLAALERAPAGEEPSAGIVAPEATVGLHIKR